MAKHILNRKPEELLHPTTKEPFFSKEELALVSSASTVREAASRLSFLKGSNPAAAALFERLTKEIPQVRESREENAKWVQKHPHTPGALRPDAGGQPDRAGKGRGR